MTCLKLASWHAQMVVLSEVIKPDLVSQHVLFYTNPIVTYASKSVLYTLSSMFPCMLILHSKDAFKRLTVPLTLMQVTTRWNASPHVQLTLTFTTNFVCTFVQTLCSWTTSIENVSLFSLVPTILTQISNQEHACRNVMATSLIELQRNVSMFVLQALMQTR